MRRRGVRLALASTPTTRCRAASATPPPAASRNWRSGYTNPDETRRSDRGYCDQDRTSPRLDDRRPTETPGVRQHAGARALASNWRVSGIFNAQSGQPAQRDSRTRQRVQRTARGAASEPNQVLDDPYGNQVGRQLPQPGGVRAAGGRAPSAATQRNGVRGPARWDGQPVAFSKLVPIQPRARTSSCDVEVFNIFNHTNLGNPGS